jgi:hypothetical protein
MRNREISEKRQKLIDEKNASELQIGEQVSVRYESVNSYVRDVDKGKSESCKILSIDGDSLIVIRSDDSVQKTKHNIKRSDVMGRYTLYIGANPFDEGIDSIRPIAFTLDSILFSLNIFGNKRDASQQYDINGTPIMEFNWNPFVYDKDGNKQYYQRGLVWNLEDKQLLINSIYEGIDCGKILVRLRGWKALEHQQANGEKDLSFKDIVDGKQRLDAVRGFISLEYPDSEGNYYNDLSFWSQHRFENHQLFSYAEMPESTTDSEVLRQFLKMNFTGIPQSKDHIEYVKSLRNTV